MDSILTVTYPALDYSLLTIDELRTVTGVPSGSDDELEALGEAIAAAITSRCNLRAAGATPATLLFEHYSEVFRLACPRQRLVLARRPIVDVVSVIEDGVTLDAEDYEVNAAPGLLQRLCNDDPAWWTARKITVAYEAGWEEVPDNLRRAAMKLATSLWSERGHDSTLRREVIGGVLEREWWVAPASDALFTPEIEELLKDYIRPLL